MRDEAFEKTWLTYSELNLKGNITRMPYGIAAYFWQEAIRQAQAETVERICRVLCEACKNGIPAQGVRGISILDGSHKDVLGNDLPIKSWAHTKPGDVGFRSWCKAAHIRMSLPDPGWLEDLLARERLEAKIEDRRGCGLACVDLERELALLGQGAGGLAAMGEGK